MSQRWKGQRRRVTDAQVRMIRAWKPLRQIARDIGVSRRTVDRIRAGYEHKQPSP